MTHGRLSITLPQYPPPALTRRSCQAAAMLGYTPESSAPPAGPPTLALTLPPASVTLLAGPSGSGKSTLLHAAAHAAKSAGWRVINASKITLPDKPAINLVGADAPDALRQLAHAGLAEARCLIRRPRELSDGQRTRLTLAIALDRAHIAAQKGAPTLLVVDEFTALLDRATAANVARSFARAVRQSLGVRAMVATCRDELVRSLAPEQTVRFSLAGDIELEHRNQQPRQRPALPDEYDIAVADRKAYDSLAFLHYRAGSPVAVVQTLAARETLTGQIVGALVVVRPTLNGLWRQYAWPDRYNTQGKRADARRLNDEVRRIARVVIDPRHRSVGLASRLVRAYLDRPLTIHTEAVAAMGRWSHFFQRAGMTAYNLPTQPRDARLLDALAHARVEPFRLATPRSAWRRAVANAGESFMNRELTRWSSQRGAEGERLRDRRDELWRRACARIATQMTAFAASVASSETS